MAVVRMVFVASRQIVGSCTHVEPLDWTPCVPCGLGGDRRLPHERGTIFGKDGFPVAKMATQKLIEPFKKAAVPLGSLFWMTGDGRRIIAGCVRPRAKRRKQK